MASPGTGPAWWRRFSGVAGTAGPTGGGTAADGGTAVNGDAAAGAVKAGPM
ncbi:hypothetical protein GCM10009639_60340 [Kitasatospora putterlickiae]|uniref:Uncharacterized protein n=1 Tax=Kitasatospora putterlickiae TaxID=221725 RepID=A0ABP4J5Z5_9ACTN